MRRREFLAGMAAAGLVAMMPWPALAKKPSVYTGVVDGVGAGGHDVVAYQTSNAAMPGNAAFTAEHGGVTYRFASDANRGLAAARNLAIGQTRTDRVMIMDADNLVRPTCLQRLAAALDDDPEAAFSWAILERFGGEAGVLSAFAWDPDRLAERV